MASNAERAATLVRALEASITGDSSHVAELYVDDVKGWAPAMSVSSAAELAVELEDRDGAFSDIELDVSPLDVSGERACVEWVVDPHALGTARDRRRDDDRPDRPARDAARRHRRRVRGRQDRVVPPVLGRGRAPRAAGAAARGVAGAPCAWRRVRSAGSSRRGWPRWSSTTRPPTSSTAPSSWRCGTSWTRSSTTLPCASWCSRVPIPTSS